MACQQQHLDVLSLFFFWMTRRRRGQQRRTVASTTKMKPTLTKCASTWSQLRVTERNGDTGIVMTMTLTPTDLRGVALAETMQWHRKWPWPADAGSNQIVNAPNGRWLGGSRCMHTDSHTTCTIREIYHSWPRACMNEGRGATLTCTSHTQRVRTLQAHGDT
jgi:hypothetical protein